MIGRAKQGIDVVDEAVSEFQDIVDKLQKGSDLCDIKVRTNQIKIDVLEKKSKAKVDALENENKALIEKTKRALSLKDSLDSMLGQKNISHI